MVIHDNENKTPTLVEPLMLIVSATVTISMLAWVLWYSRYGFDFTDEGYYLVWLANPFNYSVSNTQFGFIYHPLYQLLDGNIAALRRANILITFGLAWVFGNFFLKTVFGFKVLENQHRLTISAALATTSLILFDSWLLTPSYNSLALQAFLVAATGLLLAENRSSFPSILGWLLIGVGGWLAFMAKPTSSAALGVCSGIYLLLAGKSRICFLAISLATVVALLILSALTIDGSVSGFIGRLIGGVDELKILGGGHTIPQLLRLDSFNLSRKAIIFLLVGTIIIAFAVHLSQANSRLLIHVSTIFSVSFGLIGLAIICGFIQKPLNAGRSQELLILAVPFAAILAGVTIYKEASKNSIISFSQKVRMRELKSIAYLLHPGSLPKGEGVFRGFHKFKGFLQITLAQRGLVFAFLVFPHAYAFGTNNNYWYQGTSAAIFWIFAGLIMLDPIVSGRKLSALLLPIGLAAQLITVALIQGGIEAPYRQPQPLHHNDYMLEIGKSGSVLALSRGFGYYLTEVINVAKQAGFKKGMPIIDLTGQSPGVLYALGANNIGQAWTIGGYPGSDSLAVVMLKKAKCQELVMAWLIIEPEGFRKISTKTISSFGANMATDFESISIFKTAVGAGGYKERRVQQFLKPSRPTEVAIAACEAVRESR